MEEDDELFKQVDEALEGVENDHIVKEADKALDGQHAQHFRYNMIGSAAGLCCILQEAGVPAHAAMNTVMSMLMTYFLNTCAQGAFNAGKEDSDLKGG